MCLVLDTCPCTPGPCAPVPYHAPRMPLCPCAPGPCALCPCALPYVFLCLVLDTCASHRGPTVLPSPSQNSKIFFRFPRRARVKCRVKCPCGIPLIRTPAPATPPSELEDLLPLPEACPCEFLCEVYLLCDMTPIRPPCLPPQHSKRYVSLLPHPQNAEFFFRSRGVSLSCVVSL